MDSPRIRLNPWYFALLGLLMLVLAFFTLSKCHTLIETETTIQATPEQLWAELIDFESYPDWNPLISPIEGSAAQNEVLSFSSQAPGLPRRDVKVTVTSAMPGKELRWQGGHGIPRLLDTQHYFVIDTEGQPAGTVKLVHGQDYRGVLVPFIAKSLDTKMRAGFEAMNAALKERVEFLYPALLPGTALSTLCAPRGSLVVRLPAKDVEGGAATDQGSYSSSISYFHCDDADLEILDELGNLVIEAGYDLVTSDSSSSQGRTDYYVNLADGSEVHLGHFSVNKQLADTLSAVGKPVFDQALPESFLEGDAYRGYRIELRQFKDAGEQAELELPPLEEKPADAPVADDANTADGIEVPGLGGDAPPDDFDPGVE